MIDEAVEEIEEMQTHSSSAVAITAARALEDLLDREFATVAEFERDLERNVSALRRANPSHASLQNVMVEIRESVTGGAYETVDEAKAETEAVIEAVVDDIQRGKKRAAENAADFLEDGQTILTHDYSTTVLQAIEGATQAGDYLEVYVTEARPRHLGRKTARQLAAYDRVDPHLITDAACGHYLEDCDAVVTGMTCIADGTLYNRVGTFPIAAAADRLGVPMAVVGSGAKIVSEGFVFENDYRSSSEVMREPAEGFSVENPAYDATPVELLDAVITDEGRREF